MCGIAGIFDPRAGLDARALEADVRAMVAAVRHRGPDGEGVFVDERAGIALGHRRLAVLDTSERGAQPMSSSCGRVVVTYNGELYNHRELRARLAAEGVAFRSGCDTEVVVEAIAAWGLEAALARFVGMFAFALWDKERRRLSLVRDPFGEKPLYFGRTGSAFLFGSELRALRRHPRFSSSLSTDGASTLLMLGYIAAPLTIYDGSAKLGHGSVLHVDDGEPAAPRRWFSFEDVARRSDADPLRCNVDEAAARVGAVLERSVRARLVADVPVGAFLSSGVDSTAVVACAVEAMAGRRLRTFTVGFDDAGCDETAWAARLAAALGTEHTTFPMTAADAAALVDRLPSTLDEPFADPSQLPTLFLCERARPHVTVALTGDGGDELFGGYTRHARLARAWTVGGALPFAWRRHVADALRVAASARATTGPARLPGALGRRLEAVWDAGRLQKLAALVDAKGGEEAYLRLMSLWARPGEVVRSTSSSLRPSAWPPPPTARGEHALRRWMQLADVGTYLADGVLTKVDRASMAVALECRAPLLDVELLELAWRLRLPRGAPPKAPLRKLLARRLPPALLPTRKLGFGPPLDGWLRGALRVWAERLLFEGRLMASGIVDPAPVRARLQQHLEGRGRWHYSLWTVLMLAAWYERETATHGGAHAA